MAKKIGVLALQGAFREHIGWLRKLGAAACEVRTPKELEGIDGLIIPGGESTTMGLLMEAGGLVDPLRAFASQRPVFGTCAGMVVLARATTEGKQPLLGVLDITVRRNAFGRQTRSFEASVELRLDSNEWEGFHGIFIRAPWVESTGPGVDIIARCMGHAVGVRQGNIIAVAFHPELGVDGRLHAHFLKLVESSGG